MAAPARLRFSALWKRLGASEGAATVFDRLTAAYGERGRAYHTLNHVYDCLERLDEAEQPGEARDPVEAAIWVHDVVYDPRRSDNEARSAEWGALALSAAGVPDAITSRVRALVRATDHAGVPAGRHATLLCDIDLSIFGRDEPTFDRYQRAIRQEYAWVPEPRYRTERARVLTALLERPQIYLTGYFHDRYEPGARANLRRALAKLQS